MNHLLRDIAPISSRAWQEVDDEATRTLTHFLAARKLLELSGPHGRELAALNTGRVADLGDGPAPGVGAQQRESQPLVELRVELELARAELDAIDRGADDADLDPVIDAARSLAQAEDVAVFHGYGGGGITGLTEASPHEPVPISEDYDEYPRHVALGVARLRAAGVAGPYGIALGPRCFTGVVETTERGGWPVLEHVKQILGGPVVWAPAVDGAVIVSQRGGDAELVVGEDISIGYSSHDADGVRLYLEESLTVRVSGPEAAIHLRYE